MAITAANSPWGGRAHEVLDWAALHDVDRKIVQDDDPGLAKVAGHNIWMDPESGLTADSGEAVAAILGSMRSWRLPAQRIRWFSGVALESWRFAGSGTRATGKPAPEMPLVHS